MRIYRCWPTPHPVHPAGTAAAQRNCDLSSTGKGISEGDSPIFAVRNWDSHAQLLELFDDAAELLVAGDDGVVIFLRRFAMPVAAVIDLGEMHEEERFLAVLVEGINFAGRQEFRSGNSTDHPTPPDRFDTVLPTCYNIIRLT